MGARSEIEQNIYANWLDKRVAEWVIGNLPLLTEGSTHPPCPIFTLSLDEGLQHKVGPTYENFRQTPKIVMSGGFEGTKGHMWAVKEMREVRALTADQNTTTVLLLEPDSYITHQKGRLPIINIDQRQQLWSTSGLVDTIILLPEKQERISDDEHYLQVHKHLAPAKWCANIENNHWFDIINRQQEINIIDLVRIFIHRPEAHTSFLNITRNFSTKEVKNMLYPYLLAIINTGFYDVDRYLTSEEAAKITFEKVKQGLDS